MKIVYCDFIIGCALAGTFLRIIIGENNGD